MSDATLQSYPRVETASFDYSQMLGYVQRKLGGGTVTVELSELDMKDSVDDALAFYSKHKPLRVTESWIAPAGMSQHAWRTPGVRGVFDIDLTNQWMDTSPSYSNIEAIGLSGTQFQFYGMGSGFGNIDVRYYEYIRIWLKTLQREFGSEPDWKLSDDNKVMFIYAPGGTHVYCTVNTDVVSPMDVKRQDQGWFREYVVALSRITLGEARSKFGTIPGADNTLTLNGAALITKGEADKERLEKGLIDSHLFLGPTWG
jgi:hypothetical protein